MKPPDNEHPATGEIKILLKEIFNELKAIGLHQAQQGERTNSLEQLQSSPDKVLRHDFDGKDGLQSDWFFGHPKTATCRPELSKEIRSGPLLEEALRRYKSNSVPYWSTLYGTHLKDEEHPEIPDEVIRNSEWTAITADCWKIPHDNRVSFCFLSPASDPTILIKVRNFLSLFHRPEDTEIMKGKDFNIWDWFDNGISAYWCPGNEAPELSQKAAQQFRGDGSRTDHGNLTTISHLVAPWRRIM
ncbi:hypothetical protein BKA65DRAFT_206366 [Rhexocercosporidium sp. MPI-PUGE-AT-0058]|nr:hypothetical protein BKA65DRAFT_206366 [Rhexocercosporidium sp. MPI-PUGE-AT-0058]